MAWIDDRAWAHPKFTDLSAPAFRAYVYAVCYASGFGTLGYLTAGQLRTIGITKKQRRELVAASLFDQFSDDQNADIYIHDWEEHNGKRDKRKAADRERKRALRFIEAAGVSAGQVAENDADNVRKIGYGGAR